MPEFFVPLVADEKHEEAYLQMAEVCGCGPDEPGARVYSITWVHDRTEWTATVGETLRGIETLVKGRGRQKREIQVPRSTDDTVMAIFQGAPFMIAHDNKSRRWNLPIYAGNPSSVQFFD